MTTKPLQLVKHHGATPTAPQRPAALAEATRPTIPLALHILIPLAIGALWVVVVDAISTAQISDLGLISVMPASALALLALLTVGFCLTLRGRPVRTSVALTYVGVLIVMLYGVTALIEPEPHFSSVYRHAGIMDDILRNGAVDPSIDAYFNWPGFFGLGAVLSQAAGLDSPLALAAWGSLAFSVLFLAPLLVIFRWASDDPRVWWLGLWVFYSANWVSQDYLSPQAAGFVLWLAMLAALLTWFTPRPRVLAKGSSLRWAMGMLDPRGIRDRLRSEREAVAGHLSQRGAAGLVLTVVVIFAAIVTGHQLTPFPAIFAVCALVVFAGLQTRRLPIIMIVLLAAWISYETTPFLIGHIESLSSPVGATGSNFTKNVSGRVSGSPEHTLVVNLRLVGTAFIWLLAVAGAVRRLRAGRVDLAFAVIAITPFVLPILQPYGGEMLLRVFLFTLPVVAFFIAALAFPTARDGRGWPTTAAVLVGCCVLLGLFQFMRYGNERLDLFTEGDAAAVNAMYEVSAPGSTVLGAPNLPWRYRNYADYEYNSVFRLEAWRTAATPAPAAMAEEIALAAPIDGSYVLVTRSMKVQAELLIGKPQALDRLATLLRASPLAVQLYCGVDGDVFRVAHRDAIVAPPAVKPKPKPKPKPAAKPKRTKPKKSARAKRPRRARPAPAPRPRIVAPRIVPPAQQAPAPVPQVPPPPPPPPPPPATFDDSG